MKCKYHAIASMMFLTCFMAAGGTVKKTDVIYYPFQIEPPGAISAKSIASDGMYVELTNDDEVLLRNEFINSKRIVNNNFIFEEGRARLFAAIDDTIYVCDAKGNCMSNKFDLIVVNVERLEKILFKYFKAREREHRGS